MSRFKEVEAALIQRDPVPDKISIKYQLIKTLISDKLERAGVYIGSDQITLEIIEIFFDAEQLTNEMKSYLHYCHFHEDLYLLRGQSGQ